MTDVRYTVDGHRRVTVLADVRITARTAPSPIFFREPPVYSLDLCRGFERIGIATSFTLSAVVRHLATGTWRLTAPSVGLEVPDVDQVDSIILWDQSQPARVVFAGLVRPIAGAQGTVVKRLNADGSFVEITGVDLYGILGHRTAWPTPTTDPPWADSHDQRSGLGSEVAAGFISANLGASAIASRQVVDVSVIDTSAGLSSTWLGRLQPLDQLVGRVCRESGIACRVRMTSPGAISFTLTSPTDRSTEIVITDQGDLETVERLLLLAGSSHVIAAGQGELTARAFAAATTGATGLDRIESVYQNTNVATTGGLATAASAELERRSSGVSVRGTISASATQQIRYLDDYDVGDLLGIEVEGVRYAAQVEGVQIEINAEQESVTPILGPNSADELVRLIGDVAGLQTQFDSQIA